MERVIEESADSPHGYILTDKGLYYVLTLDRLSELQDKERSLRKLREETGKVVAAKVPGLKPHVTIREG